LNGTASDHWGKLSSIAACSTTLTREVIAQYAAEQAYSTARQEIQDKIHRLVEDRLTEKMMEREGEESYRASMRDTIILYDILVTGIELPTAIVAAINRKTEQYYIAEEYKFRVEREKESRSARRLTGPGPLVGRISPARCGNFYCPKRQPWC
jgi:regulator of protease activity HflC (stomatin/prohibitin superfamily)